MKTTSTKMISLSATFLASATIAWAGGNELTGSRALDRTLETHGGHDVWQQQGQLEYRLKDFPLGANAPFDFGQTVDLRSRLHRVEGDGFVAGFDGDRAWVTPSVESLGIPPRFMLPGNFYFVGMPFVFGDPGVNATDRGPVEFHGETYNTVSISYGDSIGDTADDKYTLYLDAQTHELHMIQFSVTYPAIRGEAPVEDAPQKALVFEKWQTVDGLTVPHTLSLYAWTDGDLQGEAATYTVEWIDFKDSQPASRLFAAPANAVIDESHQ